KTVLYPDAFKRSPSAGFDGVFHWDHWAPAIARRAIAPSDLDAIVEIKGFFLICESKDEGAHIQKGQRLLLDALVRTGLVTLITRWGKEPPGKWWQYETINYKSLVLGPTDSQSVVDQETVFISRWAEVVDGYQADQWRLRMIDSALIGAPTSVRQI